MRLLSILIIFAFLLSGCNGSFVKKENGERTGQVKRNEKIKYAALGTDDDREIVPAKYPLNMASQADTVKSNDSVLTGYDSTLMIPAELASHVFRIQLFSSNTYGPATREEKIAREVFDSTVFMEYEVPYYKVRVGSFADQSQAENYLPAAKESGYTTAWVVKVAQDIHILDDIYSGDNIPPLIDSTAIKADSILTDSIITDQPDESNPEN